MIDVKGKVITIDTIVLKRKQLIKLVMKKAAYILKVKNNQKGLKDDVKTYFDLKIKNDSSNIDILETPYKKEHGGIKKRTYYNSYDTNCIHNKKKWQSIRAIRRRNVYRKEK